MAAEQVKLGGREGGVSVELRESEVVVVKDRRMGTIEKIVQDGVKEVTDEASREGEDEFLQGSPESVIYAPRKQVTDSQAFLPIDRLDYSEQPPARLPPELQRA